LTHSRLAALPMLAHSAPLRYVSPRMPPHAPAPSLDFGLFLDVDGTLVDIADAPGDVVVDAELKALLAALSRRLHGAVALVSGRSVAAMDELFDPLVLPAAGLHGLERRAASGELHRAPADPESLRATRASLTAFVGAHPNTLLEDKGRALALHFRLAPEFETSARHAVQAAVRELGDAYHVQEGKMVLEIKPSTATKATAVEAFLREPPFLGRTPVFIGDDLTDAAGFRVVEAAGGISIGVGYRIQGQWRLENPTAVRRWLGSITAL
jgi:trehalose 6-phosphate phosphatase